MTDLQTAITTLSQRIAAILEPFAPSIYLYGSCVLNDFKMGWSDIDILVLTKTPISEEQAARLVTLRQTLLEEEPNNPYFRSFEGGMLTLDTFLSGEADRVVYWGTSGERITDRYQLDAFSAKLLVERGILLYGTDVRVRLPRPTFDDLKAAVRYHYDTIRKYVKKTGRNFYSFGWLLDISRCLYTLRTGKILSKTAAGEWALREDLCPCADALERAVAIRKEPDKYRRDKATLDYAENLFECIQRYADVLEKELNI